MATSKSRSAPTSLADVAYVGLRDRLVSLDIPPGEAINEDDLMRELGAGRTPVREAIKRLALECLTSPQDDSGAGSAAPQRRGLLRRKAST